MPSFNYDNADQKRFESSGSGKMPNTNLGIQWDGDKPYYLRDDGTKMYASPAEGAYKQPGADPKLKAFADSSSQPGQSFLHHRGVWDADTGQWHQDIDWNNIGSLAMGAALTAGFGSALAGAAAPTVTSSSAMPALAGSAPEIGAGEIGVSSTAGLGGFVPTTANGISAAGSQGMNWGSIFNGVKKGYDTYSNVSDVLGSAAKGANQQNNTQDQLKLLLAQLKLKQNEDATVLPAKRLSTSVQGSMAAHATPTKFNWGGPGSVAHGGLMPSFSGGMTGALENLDPETKQLGQTNVHDMLLQELQGGRGGGNTDMNAPEVGQTSGFDKVLGGSALTSALLAALAKRKGSSTNQTQPGGFDFGGDYA